MSGRMGHWAIATVVMTMSMTAPLAAAKSKARSKPSTPPPTAAASEAAPSVPAGLTQQTATADGVIASLEATRVQITKKDGSSWTFVVDPKTTKKDAIAVGDTVHVEFSALMRNGEPEGPASASRITKRGGTSQPAAAAAATTESPSSNPEPSSPDTGGYDTTGSSYY